MTTELPKSGSFNAQTVNPPSWLGERAAFTTDRIFMLRRHHRRRARSVQALDGLVNRLRATLRREGLADNTYVVFSSDNGYHLGQHRLTIGKRTAYDHDIRVPLAPFMGTLAVAPSSPMVGQPGVTLPGIQSSRPPGEYGGNLDLKDLTAGSTLFLPVFRRGALFYAGDPHGVQADGEVSGTALEQSLTGVFRFVVHKGRPLRGPRAETA